MGFTMARLVSLFLISILILLIGFQLDAEEYKSPVYTQYVAEITRSFSEQMKKEFSIDCIGSGGSMPYDVEDISIKFVAYQRATIEEARALEVKVTERLVQMINAHEKIRPFLKENPFPYYRTKVGISFYKRNNSPYLDGSVAYVSQVNSKIYYRAENPDNPDIYNQIKDEPYEEALKIVQNNSEKNTPPQSKNI